MYCLIELNHLYTPFQGWVSLCTFLIIHFPNAKLPMCNTSHMGETGTCASTH